MHNSYPERQRDWPDEARQPDVKQLLCMKGANSCRTAYFVVLEDESVDTFLLCKHFSYFLRGVFSCLWQHVKKT